MIEVTVPTVLTIGRIAAALAMPAVLLVFSAPDAYWIIAALFLVAAITDFLDGFLARKLAQQSRLGGVLDSIGDKILVGLALLVAVAGFADRSWLVLPASLIVAREFLVAGLREAVGDRSSLLKVSGLAKWKTAVQMSALFLLLLCCALEAGPGSTLVVAGILAIWVAALMTLITGMDYFLKSLPALTMEPSDD